jgi:hypothetical protein
MDCSLLLMKGSVHQSMGVNQSNPFHVLLIDR